MIRMVGIVACFWLAPDAVAQEVTLDAVKDLPKTQSSAQEAGLTVLLDGIRDEAIMAGIEHGRNERAKELNAELDRLSDHFDKILNFKPFLLESPSGALIIPPIVVEYGKSAAVSSSGRTLEEKDVEYEVVQPAELVLQPPTWREFLFLADKNVRATDPSILELASKHIDIWRLGVDEGWAAGRRLAEDEFETNLRRLRRSFIGIIYYHQLVEKQMINELFVAENDKEIIIAGNKLSIGRRVIEINKAMTFNADATQWKSVIIRNSPRGES